MAIWTCEKCSAQFERDKRKCSTSRFCSKQCYDSWQADSNKGIYNLAVNPQPKAARIMNRNERWSALDSRNDDVKRLIRAGDSEENIRRRYPMSDTVYSVLQGQATGGRGRK